MTAYLKTLIAASQFILLVALISTVFGFITQGRFTLDYIFTANFFIGAVIICVGLFMKFFPGMGFFKNLKTDTLTDHSTFNERFIFGLYLPRQEKAYGIVLLGITVIIITGLIELALWALGITAK